jgi:hypothetical protein
LQFWPTDFRASAPRKISTASTPRFIQDSSRAGREMRFAHGKPACATSSEHHEARSTPGNFCRHPDFGGHSIENSCCEGSANHHLRKPTPRRFSRLAASVRPSYKFALGLHARLLFKFTPRRRQKILAGVYFAVWELTALPNPCSWVKWCKIVATSNMRKLNQERQALQVVAEIWILLVICVFIALRIIDSHLFRSFASRFKGL